jgi:hypothetical protein
VVCVRVRRAAFARAPARRTHNPGHPPAPPPRTKRADPCRVPARAQHGGRIATDAAPGRRYLADGRHARRHPSACERARPASSARLVDLGVRPPVAEPRGGNGARLRSPLTTSAMLGAGIEPARLSANGPKPFASTVPPSERLAGGHASRAPPAASTYTPNLQLCRAPKKHRRRIRQQPKAAADLPVPRTKLLFSIREEELRPAP